MLCTFCSVGTGELTVEDFERYEDPTKAFYLLSSKVEEYFMHVKFTKIRRACLQHTRSPVNGQFSMNFTDAISSSKDLDGLLDVLSESNYWNFIDIRIMEAMVVYSGNQAAKTTLENYVGYLSKFKLDDVLPKIPVCVDTYSKYATIEDKFNCINVNALTVGDILKHRCTFSYEICGIDPNIPKLCSIKTGCLQLMWSIPRECASNAYTSALANVHKFEIFGILYIKIEYYPTIYSPKYLDHINSTSSSGMYVIMYNVLRMYVHTSM